MMQAAVAQLPIRMTFFLPILSENLPQGHAAVPTAKEEAAACNRQSSGAPAGGHCLHFTFSVQVH